MKVLCYGEHSYEKKLLQQAFEHKHQCSFTKHTLSVKTASESHGYDAICIGVTDVCDAAVLRILHSKGIGYIAARSVGFDNIDISVARELGIKVANAPEYSPSSVAEHAVALLMALNRKLLRGWLLRQTHDFRLDSLCGFDVHGKTIGIIGTGKIGMQFARIMNGFGTTLLGYDPKPHPDAAAIGLQYVALDVLLAQADIISIHCLLSDCTRHLLQAKEFAQMKAGAIVINTARGGVLDTQALVDALESGHLGGACLDVYEFEHEYLYTDMLAKRIHDPLYARLCLLENVVMTAHQAYLTNEALHGIAQATAHNLTSWQNTGTSPYDLC